MHEGRIFPILFLLRKFDLDISEVFLALAYNTNLSWRVLHAARPDCMIHCLVNPDLLILSQFHVTEHVIFYFRYCPVSAPVAGNVPCSTQWYRHLARGETGPCQIITSGVWSAATYGAWDES